MTSFRHSLFALTALCALGTCVAAPVQAAAGWHALANIPTPVGAAAVGEVNGIIYVAGGQAPGASAVTQAFNPAKNTWSTVASLPETLYQGDGTATINGALYVAGGWNASLPTNTLYVFNPASNSWSTKATMSHLSGCGVSAEINSLLYVTSPCNGFTGYASLLDVYDPAANAWTSLAPSLSAHGAGAGAAINGLLYVAGGVNNSNAVTGATEVYNPATNSWKALAAMPTPVQAAASVELDGQLYVFGGDDGTGTPQSLVQVYNPVKNKWTVSSYALPAAIVSAGAVVTDGIAFVEGGGGPSPVNEDLTVLPTIP
jgi:N-acetylneuraminic acid mutarotase